MISPLNHGMEFRKREISYVLDMGVNRIMFSVDKWLMLESRSGRRQPKLNRTKRKFVNFGTRDKLPCIRMSKFKLKAVAGATICTTVYIIKGLRSL